MWFWGQGTRPVVPTLKEHFGVDGAVISAVDLVNGLALWAPVDSEGAGATGFLDTDYAAKARYGLNLSSRGGDFLLLHIEAPDEAGHMGRADLKQEAIERIDELIIGPMLDGLNTLGDFALLLMPDHATPSKLKTHSAEPVPFALINAATFRKRATPRRAATLKVQARRTAVLVVDGYHLIESLFGRPEGRIEMTGGPDGTESCPRSRTRDGSRGTRGGAFIGKGDERMADRRRATRCARR